MKLGARVLKTGIAIIIALFLSQLLQLPSPVFAGIAAIFAVQPTIYRSYLSIIEQIQGNIVGAFIAVSFVLLFGNDVFIIGLAAIIVISINLKLKIENTIGLSLVTMIAIMESPGDEFITFAFIRFSTIMLGVLSAFVVNLVFLPPKYENKLYYKIYNVSEEIMRWIRLIHASEHKLLKNDIGKIKEDMIKLEQLYLLYKEERNYFKRSHPVKLRKLVIYRQMISSTKRALQTLRRLHRFENELNLMPESFQTDVHQELDYLVNHHEQLLLRFVGKIRPLEEEHNISFHKKDLFHLLREHQKKMEEQDEYMLYHMMQLVSAITEYGEHLEHLDRLINSFQLHHKGDNKVTIVEETE
ncbi:aromatic acid exporter family protein [Bacillus aquiflavi]|uniref:Aromatic acid exporter family protein n=1 Tax=Bacillus aquiflavi TaxID=2672567 RepID=A0A6B3VWL8_9BACI|nr:aromatic acid exporter family protein [Bacillus aquiflavi]MBA4536299.1 aromatic acid exporter family protein [Bacillus aquiflavi]NEY80667.1 aromatic acid exporter family protein [Bacillus aquiflavi]